MNYYPIAINLKGRRVLVAGGGLVAQRKIKGLIESKASVTVVSPSVTRTLKQFVKKGRLTWIKREVSKKDLQGAYFAIAATNKANVNEQVSRYARQAGVKINVVDRPVLSDFISPAIIRTRKAIVTVYTDGKDPVLSRDLKNFLKEHWNAFLLYRRKLNAHTV